MVLSMERWVGKVAIVTGASSGIGEAIVRKLVQDGMIVAGLARRKEKVEQIAKELSCAKGQLHAVKCDVTKEEDILNAFKWVTETLGPVHVLINNAGITQNNTLYDGDTEMWKKLLDTNVLGLCIATREAIRIMKSHNIDGYIVHMNSFAGHKIMYYPHMSIYPASKYAVTALAETLRLELVQQDSSIKITSISPGVVETEIIEAAGMSRNRRAEVFGKYKILEPEDVADSVEYVLSTPPHVQIKELIIKPVKEPF